MTTQHDIPKVPPTEPIGSAAFWAVQKCPKEEQDSTVGMVTVPAEPIQDIDITNAIQCELETEANRWAGQDTTAELDRLVVLDADGNEIPGARIVARYDMRATE